MDEAFGGDPGLSRKELDHDQRHATYNLSCQVRLRTTLRNLTSGLGFIIPSPRLMETRLWMDGLEKRTMRDISALSSIAIWLHIGIDGAHLVLISLKPAGE